MLRSHLADGDRDGRRILGDGVPDADVFRYRSGAYEAGAEETARKKMHGRKWECCEENVLARSCLF